MRVNTLKIIALFFLVVFSSCQLKPKVPTVLSTVRPRPNNIQTVDITIPRKVYNESLKEQNYLRKLRIIPIVLGAQNEGTIPEYRLFDVEEGGVPYLLGLRTADILVAANDFIIYEPEKFKAYLVLLSREKEASIEIRRGANPILFKYSFVD